MKSFSGKIVIAAGLTAAAILTLYFAPTLQASLPLTAAILSAGIALLRSDGKPVRENRGESLIIMICSASVTAILTHRFFDVLRDRSFTLNSGTVIATVLILSIPAFLFFCRCFALRSDRNKPMEKTGKLTPADGVILIAFAASVITICSKSSPLYPFNDWSDSNCYFTVGKAMAHGKVLYRDIYEQKGILLYLLHTAAYFISPRTFLGMWLWEIAAASAFLILSAKTLLLWAPRRILPLLFPVAALIYTLPCFVFGDLAEEFCLPLLAYALYAGMRANREDRTLRRVEWLCIGITSSCVLWIKYSMVAFFPGWVLVPAYSMMRQRDLRHMGEMVLYVALGIVLVTAPVTAYFAFSHALNDLFTGYFYNNIFLYYRGNSTPLILRTIRNLFNTFRDAAPLYGAVMLSLPWLLAQKDRRPAAQVMLSMAALCLGIFNADQMHTYYAFILALYMPLVCLPLRETADLWFPRVRKSALFAAAAVAAMIIVFTNCTNLYMLEYKKEDLPQYRFAAVMDRYDNASMLNYRFLDGGFYTVSGIVPEEKYFCLLNLSLPEMKEEQDRCVREGRADFLVTMDRDREYPLYRLLCEETFPRTGESHTYRLYIRGDIPE